MDVKLVAPFVDAAFNILPQLGFKEVKRGKLGLKDKMVSTLNITALVGLSKKIRGNIAYSMSETTAKNVASVMMMGMPVAEFDAMAQSAISELANMLAANAAINYEAIGKAVEISPPTLIIGENVTVRVSQVKTLVVEIITEAGTLELNIGLEV